jgi:hypothetical protein
LPTASGVRAIVMLLELGADPAFCTEPVTRERRVAPSSHQLGSLLPHVKTSGKAESLPHQEAPDGETR